MLEISKSLNFVTEWVSIVRAEQLKQKVSFLLNSPQRFPAFKF